MAGTSGCRTSAGCRFRNRFCDSEESGQITWRNAVRFIPEISLVIRCDVYAGLTFVSAYLSLLLMLLLDCPPQDEHIFNIADFLERLTALRTIRYSGWIRIWDSSGGCR